MKKSQLPDGLSFPLPPARIDRSLERLPLRPPVAAAYLNDIRRWHDAVVRALDTADPTIDGVENLTTRARARLSLLLRAQWTPTTRLWALHSGYGLKAFPAQHAFTRADDPMKAVLEVLRWRAAVIHYLTDLWDVLGKPELEMGECAAVGMFIRPARLEGRCVYCLTEYGPGYVDPYEHDCPMVGNLYPV